MATDRLVPLLLACNVSAEVPGQYPLVFTATNSAGLGARVVRQLVVKAVCPIGEALCQDKVSSDAAER
jgi:hypothetical protein